MAIDDNTTYGLTGAQIKELPAKIDAVKGLAKVLTSADYNANSSNWSDTDPTNFNCIGLWKLDAGVYSWGDGVTVYSAAASAHGAISSDVSGFHGTIIVRHSSNVMEYLVSWAGTTELRISKLNGSSSPDYVTAYRTLVDSTNIANNLTQEFSGKVLDARQGKVLNDKIGGDLSNLTTTDKSSLINAINELNTNLGNIDTALQTLLNGTGA